MIHLYQFPRLGHFPNLSPFCTKLETWLRIAKLPYENHFINDPRQAPKKRLPYITWDDRKLGDSSLVLEEIKAKKGDLLDGHLSKEQKAIALAFQRLLEDDLMLTVLYYRWVQADHWPKFREKLFGSLPFPVSWILPKVLHKKLSDRLKLHGLMDHTDEEIKAIAERDVQAVANFLGEKPFFFGDQPSTIDCVCFGVIGSILQDFADIPQLAMAKRHQNLVSFCERMLVSYYPELSQTKVPNA